MITQACDRKSSCVRAGRLAGISSKDTQDGVLAQAFWCGRHARDVGAIVLGEYSNIIFHFDIGRALYLVVQVASHVDFHTALLTALLRWTG